MDNFYDPHKFIVERFHSTYTDKYGLDKPNNNII